ncbi:hypothetical protein DMUE_6063, partial [Dictyocoela muelleri]
MARERVFESVVLKMYNASIEKVIANMRVLGLLASYQPCLTCGIYMEEQKLESHMDKYRWYCGNKLCENYKTSLSIRHRSVFIEFRKPLSSIFLYIYCWASSKNIKDVCKDYSVSRPTLSAIYKFLRSRVSEFFAKEPIRLGGPGIICQVDESLFVHKVKYHRGRSPREQVWVFAIVDTSTSPSIGYMRVVEDRSASTLLPIIQEICRTGTTIHSDMWAGYREIFEKTGFAHATVNHRYNFVNPETGVHTQHAESYWNVKKGIIKTMKGV